MTRTPTIAVALLIASIANAQTPKVCVSGDLSFTITPKWVTVTYEDGTNQFKSVTVDCWGDEDSLPKTCEGVTGAKTFDSVTMLADGAIVWTHVSHKVANIILTRVITDATCQGGLQ